jgi:hypothetical protein
MEVLMSTTIMKAAELRARDMHMAAAVDVARRTVLVTGGIDQNQQVLQMKIDLPEPGLWTFIKAETNLTDDPWFAWQITFGGLMRLPVDPKDRLVQCRQFKRNNYIPERGAVLFCDGEVRPGEPILKIFRVDVAEPSAEIFANSLSHTRGDAYLDPEAMEMALIHGIGAEFPVMEVL